MAGSQTDGVAAPMSFHNEGIYLSPDMKEDKMVDILAAPKNGNILDDPYIREQEMNIKTDFWQI